MVDVAVEHGVCDELAELLLAHAVEVVAGRVVHGGDGTDAGSQSWAGSAEAVERAVSSSYPVDEMVQTVVVEMKQPFGIFEGKLSLGDEIVELGCGGASFDIRTQGTEFGEIVDGLDWSMGEPFVLR